MYSFGVNFMIPYLIYDDYAGLGSKVGFIFGSLMIVAIGFIYFCVPECKGKTLEEVNALFANDVPLRHFGKTDGKAFLEAHVNSSGKHDGELNEVEKAKSATEVQAVERQEHV